jgi:carbon-monoxide dehydrogenase medium subunit
MLLNLREYCRPAGGDPSGLDAALALLARPSIRTVPLAGGDGLLGGGSPAVEAVVDLQSLGLDYILYDASARTLRIGATTTRAGLGDAVADPAPPGVGALARFLARAAAHAVGSLQANRATVGGSVAASHASDALVAALLACDADVILYDRAGEHRVLLGEFLAQRRLYLGAPALITGVVIPVPVSAAGYGLAAVGRTPSDSPIVLAAAAVVASGTTCASVGLALGGVAGAPVRAAAVEETLIGSRADAADFDRAAALAAAGIQPPGDFRGSPEYRAAMAQVLSRRALADAWHAAQSAGEAIR